MYAEPGVIGPPHAPTTAWVASAPFTRSSLNHSSRKSAALIVNSRTSSWMSRPVHPRNRAAVRAQLRISDSRMFGGTTYSSAFMRSAMCSKYVSNSTHASASALLSAAMFSCVARQVAPERQRGAVGERHEVVRRDDRDLVSEPLELQLVDDAVGMSETT